MTDDQVAIFVDRFVQSWEKIAKALEGLSETYRQKLEQELHPPQRVYREAVVSRVPSEEDRIREDQGATDEALGEWLSEVSDIGVREREWIAANPDASPEIGPKIRP